MSTLKPRSLRTADVARQAGCSTQLVRNLEQGGVLTPVPRTPSGYRQYTDSHLHTVRAYLALSLALGPVEAKRLLRSVPTVPAEEILAALDQAHAGLHHERHQLAAARRAAELIATEPVDDYIDTDAMNISELASALGVRASTLRHWEAEDLVVPDRWSNRRIRRYLPAHVRDARIVHQLRLTGQRIDTLRPAMPALRAGRRRQSLNEALSARQAAITRRSQALLDAAASLRTTLHNTENASAEAITRTTTHP